MAHGARIYDFILGGKDNFPADREAAERALAAYPGLGTAMRENRPSVHEIAQAADPTARIVYTDNDPIVLTHARVLLTSTPEGRTAYVDADLREPGLILAAPELRHTLDFTRPVALSLFAILHFVPDDAGAHDIIRMLLDALPAGSYLAMSHATLDLDPAMEHLRDEYQNRDIPLQLRSRDEVARFFIGLDLVDPGIVPAPRWRPDGSVPPDGGISGYGVVARKP